MRGVTNAVPAGGGIALFAEGSLSADGTLSSGPTVITLPKRALFVVLGQYDTGMAIATATGDSITVPAVAGEGDNPGTEYALMTDGITLEMGSTHRGYSAEGYYRAYA